MKILALDTETNIAIKQDLYIISIDDGTGPRIVYNRSEHGPNVPLDIINEISSADLIIMHGSLFDIPLLQKAGCTLKRIWDTMLAERVLNGGNQEHWVGLADLVHKYTGVTLDKTLQVSDWTQAVSAEQLEYSKNDVRYLKTIYENQFEFIQKSGLLSVLELRQILFKEWAIDLYNGLLLDHQFIKEFKPIVWAEYIKARLALLNKLPVRFFIPSNVPKKSYIEIIDNLENHSILLPEKSAALKKQTLVQLREDFDYELLKSYFMNNPTSDMLIDIGASHFVNKVLKHFKVDLPSTGKQEMLDYLAEHSDGELAQILGIVLHARMCQKIYGTYLDGKVTEQIAEDGSIRTKLEMTVTGRITLKPINNIPAPDDNKTEFQNKLSHMFIPTKGYKRWVGDYCLHPDTELLTQKGWVKVLDIQETDEVYQVNKDSLVGNFVKPERIIKKEYSGKLFWFGGTRGRLGVTENHTMLFGAQQTGSSWRGKSYINKRYITKSHEPFPTKRCVMFNATRGNGLISSYSEHEIWMACLLQADSHLDKKGAYTIQVSKDRKVQKVTELLKKQGRSTGRIRPTHNNPVFNWRLRYSTELLNAKKFNLSKLGSNQVDTFVEALKFWDGGILETVAGTAFQWGSTDLETVEQVQKYLVTSGYEAHLSIRRYENENHNTYYSLSIRKSNGITMSEKYCKKEEDYSGLVGCVTVPEGFILVRYEGQTFITGNCSLEDVVAGIFYRDSYKLETLHKKFDPYLLLAARLFKEFEYTSPDQTKELKSKYKSLRQAVKGAALAKNFSAGKDKFHSMLTRACEKQGIVFKLTPEEADYEYKQLYPDISAAHARLGYLVGGIVADNLEVEDEKESHYLNVSTFPRGGGLTKEQIIASSVRERILKASGLIVGSNSVFGQRRTYDAHKCYTGVTPRYAKVGVTQLSNHPVQASAAEAKDLAVILVKKFYPSVLIPGTIHDSLICDVPENGIVDDCGTISLEEVAEGLSYLMKLAFWVVFNSPVGVDGGYVERGLK